MKLENLKFGDKFKTRGGKIAIVVGEHKNARKHWYEFLALERGMPMLGNQPYRFYAYDDGTAFEGFEWLNIVEDHDD